MLSLLAKNIRQPIGLEIKESPIHGLGVFACLDFKKGDLIETAPIILLSQADREYLQPTALYHYYFVLDRPEAPVAIGLGYSSLYNHQALCNAAYEISVRRACLWIRACQAIREGEEITINYSGKPGDDSPVYFPPSIAHE